jgi:hypothetical protein
MVLSIVIVRRQMALSNSVEESLKEAEQSLRNALAFAARQERPMVCSVIADMIQKIDTVIQTDSILDKLESREPGSRGDFGSFFGDEM